MHKARSPIYDYPRSIIDPDGSSRFRIFNPAIFFLWISSAKGRDCAGDLWKVARLRCSLRRKEVRANNRTAIPVKSCQRNKAHRSKRWDPILLLLKVSQLLASYAGLQAFPCFVRGRLVWVQKLARGRVRLTGGLSRANGSRTAIMM